MPTAKAKPRAKRKSTLKINEPTEPILPVVVHAKPTARVKAKPRPPLTAIEDFSEQVNDGAYGGEVNVSRLWRVGGAKPGRNPAAWLALAGSFVRGVAEYHIAVDRESYRESFGFNPPEKGFASEVVFTEQSGEEKGDIYAAHIIAYAYALYVDADA